MKNVVILVDANDQPLGVAEKLYAHQHQLRHRAFSIFIYRENNKQCEILLQQRHPDKYHSGGLWTNTCCSHPAPDENIIVAAERRLYEEMGIKTTLTEIGAFCYQADVGKGLMEHEYDHIFAGKIPEGSFSVNAAEVINYRWITVDALQAELAQQPKQFTPWLAEALGIFVLSRS